MSCDRPTSSLHLEVLHDEAQNLKDEIQREKRKQANIQQRITSMLRDNNINLQQQDMSLRKLKQALQQKIDHYTKVQKVLSLQVQHTENVLAEATTATSDDEQQDLDTLLATLKQDLADADEQLKALQS